MDRLGAEVDVGARRIRHERGGTHLEPAHQQVGVGGDERIEHRQEPRDEVDPRTHAAWFHLSMMGPSPALRMAALAPGTRYGWPLRAFWWTRMAKLVGLAPDLSVPVNRRGPPHASTLARLGTMVMAFRPSSSAAAYGVRASTMAVSSVSAPGTIRRCRSPVRRWTRCCASWTVESWSARMT